jgi:putative PEP-CTERM system integral membrane protein
VVAASFTLFIGLQQQPQVEAFARLQTPAQTDRARQELLAKSESIRQGLVNAYLWSYRYISSHADNNHIQVMYQSLGVPGVWAQSLQATYNSLMSPFLYQGSSADPERAAKLYAEFFDAPIQRAEQKAINVEEHEDWAEIELYEVYENQTNENQEILYYFSLPESAVVTGVWLGDTGDRQKRFPYVVAPRGAAQKVYNQQVQRQVDPALLEQVGPRHYRLRAFPVPPKLRIGERLEANQTRPTEMHLWLTYKVLRQQQGWALPNLAEKRNLYWTSATERLRNGKPVQVPDTWVEPFLTATSTTSPQPHTANLANGTQVIAQPLSEAAYVLPKNQRFAVILDISRSMGSQVQAVKQTFDWLKQQGFTNGRLEDNEADLYLPATAGAIPQRIDSIHQFDPDNVTFFGMLQPKEMLRQFDQLRGSTVYDGILLITDAGSYELADDKKNLPKISSPLWFIHLGAFSPAYDDATLTAIQTSGGGVGTQISEVLRRLSTQAALGENTVTVVDGYAWQVTEIDPADPQTPSPQVPPAMPSATSKPTGFESIAARLLVLGLGRQRDLNQLENLDAIHAIAKTYPMVTPYSSMLVLVNDEQRAALKRAEAERDRFDRTVESGNEELTQPFNPMEAVPSPSTVGAIMMAAIGLLLARRQRRRVRQL